MSDYTDDIDLAGDAGFLKKVERAIVTAAIDVKAENPATANHAARAVLATRVLGNPAASAAQMAIGVVTNVAISSGSSDSDIQFTVNSQWDAYAS